MPLSRQEKEKIVKELSESLSRVRSVVLTDFTGLGVAATQKLRRMLSKERVDYQVAKKTLINLALRSAGLKIDLSHAKGPLALALSYEDEVAPAKLLHQFARTHEALKVIGGILEKRLIGADEVKRLAFLPGKHELRAKVVSTIAAPLSGLVGALEGNLRKLVHVLSAIKK